MKAPAKKFRPCPPNELGKPQRKFSETFSVVTLFERKYFDNPTLRPAIRKGEA